jgi:hypothetical protein
MQTVILHHGTTKHRAEAIMKNGPDVNYRGPGELVASGEFSLFRVGAPFWYGSPEDYAKQKAANFPGEGGPAILEVEVPEVIVLKADLISEVLFQPGYGLEELLQAWPSLSMRVFVP